MPANGNADLPGSVLYVIQNVPPVQIVVPFAFLLILTMLVAACIVGIVAIAMLLRVVTRPASGQTLRVNED